MRFSTGVWDWGFYESKSENTMLRGALRWDAFSQMTWQYHIDSQHVTRNGGGSGILFLPPTKYLRTRSMSSNVMHTSTSSRPRSARDSPPRNYSRRRRKDKNKTVGSIFESPSWPNNGASWIMITFLSCTHDRPGQFE